MSNKMIIQILTCLLFILTACGQQQTQPVYEIVSPAEFNPGDAIPVPTEKVILTLSGAITLTNADDTLIFDISTLEKLGLVQYTVTDPWLNTKVTYSGILLSDLLDVAKVSASAKIIQVIALNDYAADIPIDDVRKQPILLATQADGEYMTVENNGPTRIIFPYDNYADLTAARNMSVWNIERIIIE